MNNVAERLSLYQQLDNLENKEALDKFAITLIDRFGPLPRSVKELFKSFELRWLAEEAGIEKLVIKSSSMVCYFVSNPQSRFYDSESFQQVLNYIKGNPKTASSVRKTISCACFIQILRRLTRLLDD